MTVKPSDTSNGPLRALYEWLIGTPATPPASRGADALPRDGHPTQIGHYAITRMLGAGGMGIVYAARDRRLERDVALKTLSARPSDASPTPSGADETSRKRFWREARAAASVNHPNICQIYEIGEDGDALFIAMELLEGETLAERLRRGPLNVSEAVRIVLGILAALEALHTRGIVHRDLKPSNVFLTPHGVKLLDFGLARPELSFAPGASADLTRTGVMVGTPRYMAPEQITGDPFDARADLFAVGAILFEMLSGRPAFTGRTIIEVLHATVSEQPPALGGSPAVAAVDRIIRRALSKRPSDRPASAEAMAAELRAVRGVAEDDTRALAHALTRLVVLPFRALRPDPESDFLAFSLPDAIATSLSTVPSLVVRSSAVAVRFAGDTPDLKALAAEADVDRVVMGTLLRSGDQLRVTTQLLEAPAGTIVTSHTFQSSLGDLFRLQDDIAHQVSDALSLPLGGSRSPAPDSPHNARAYELYLRGNEWARTYDGLPRARELYEQCVQLDPSFAPAWAQLGRCHRVIGKFIAGEPDSEQRSEEALRRALTLNPRLSIAHKFYANLEADMGHADRALLRLLEEAARHGNDPELFAGLVHACRYCGLFDESIAAHTEARRLDPNVPTSLEQTLLMAGDIDRLTSMTPPPIAAGADDHILVIGLAMAGRREEARTVLLRMLGQPRISTFRKWTEYLMAWIDRRTEDMEGGMAEFGPLTIMNDPEAIFQEGWFLCDAGLHEKGFGHLRRAVSKGYYPVATLEGPQFDALRRLPAFQTLIAQAEAGRRAALETFHRAGGARLLGVVSG